MKLKTSTKYPKMAAKSCTQKLKSHICRLLIPIKPIFFWKFSPEIPEKSNKSTRRPVGGARAPRIILSPRFSNVVGTYLRRESFGVFSDFRFSLEANILFIFSGVFQQKKSKIFWKSRIWKSQNVGRSASQNAISVNFDARFERFGLCFPTIKIARANAARGANDPRYLVLLLTFSHHEVMTGQT